MVVLKIIWFGSLSWPDEISKV